jgi:hypothetical protein
MSRLPKGKDPADSFDLTISDAERKRWGGMSVRDLRFQLAQTQKEVEDKKEELRQLVGRKYRDLLTSADGIITMNALGEKVTSDLAIIYTSFERLNSREKHAQKALPLTSMSNSSRKLLAQLITQLTNAPETIWEFISANELVQACRCYLHASSLYLRYVQQ